MTEILSCPFCGSTPKVFQREHPAITHVPLAWIVQCQGCTAETCSEHRQWSLDYWNRRHTHAPQTVPQGVAPQGWQWVKCSERMPPSGTMVLLANMNASEARHWCFVDWYHSGTILANHKHDQATHWMPLPAAPATQEDVP